MAGSRIQGYKNSLATMLTKVQQRTGVIDIGLKSAQLRGDGILGTGSGLRHSSIGVVLKM